MIVNGKEYSQEELEKAVKLYDALRTGELVQQLKEAIQCQS